MQRRPGPHALQEDLRALRLVLLCTSAATTHMTKKCGDCKKTKRKPAARTSFRWRTRSSDADRVAPRLCAGCRCAPALPLTEISETFRTTRAACVAAGQYIVFVYHILTLFVIDDACAQSSVRLILTKERSRACMSIALDRLRPAPEVRCGS